MSDAQPPQDRTPTSDADPERRPNGTREERSEADVSRPLLPEEAAVGSDDVDAQGRAILADSEDRVNDESAGIVPPDEEHVHRRAEDTV